MSILRIQNMQVATSQDTYIPISSTRLPSPKKISSSCIPLYSTGGSNEDAFNNARTEHVCCISGQSSSENCV